MKSTLWLLPFAALLLAACGGEAFTYPQYGGPSGTIPGSTVPPPPAPPANWTMSDNALVTTGLEQQSPTLTDSFNGLIPLAHLGVAGVTRGYEFTTPTNTPFAFSVIAVEEGNTGIVNIWLGHSQPTGAIGAESLFSEGMNLEGPDLTYGGNWWHTAADGAVTLSVRGSVTRSQVLVFAVATSAGMEVFAVRLKIGAVSDVNIQSGVVPAAGTISRKTIYSSDEDGFGLPAIAVSGDRYSVTAYDDDASGSRVRRWQQYDSLADVVTGGESQSLSPDSGSWRDQEIAALNNVLAIAYTGNNLVQVETSLDRGATFGAVEILNETSSVPVNGQRLVQIEIAQDYKLAVAYWRTIGSPGNITSQLCLAEATPTGFDANSTPTGYSYAPPWIVHSVTGGVMPVVMDIEYSTGGDLVIGYGYNEFIGWATMVSFRCAIRYASGTVVDQLIDSEVTGWGNDPSVAVLGSGSNIQVFYAYEKIDGITLRELRNGGTVPGNTLVQGGPGAYLPSVHARMQGGKVRVDMMYLSPQNDGWSLKRVHWDDFMGAFTSTTHTNLFESTSQAGGTPLGPTFPGKLVNTAGWMGYDAATDGDDVAISLHTRVIDVYAQMGGGTGMPPMQSPAAPPSYSGTPTLLPGMTGSVPAPNASHQSKLEIIVID